MSNSSAHDFLVIGAGSGGIAAAIRAAEHGARVALIDPRPLGGTCVNVGCVPKKAMWIAAELAYARRHAAALGFASAAPLDDWSQLLERRTRYIDNIHQSYRARFEKLGIETIEAHASFRSAEVIEAGPRLLRAPHVLIATGAKPQRPELPGAELGLDSDGFFALTSAPKRTALIGAGYIAVELAAVLRALGSEVTLLGRGQRLLSRFDHDTTEHLAELLRGNGVSVQLGQEVRGLRREPEGVFAEVEAGAQGPFDQVIWATGRRPNTDALGLERLGLATDSDGYLEVDEAQNTTLSGLYALGDVTRAPALTPVAIRAGRALSDRLFGGQPARRLELRNVPTVVFSHPPLASVGLSEHEAREQHGAAVRVYRTQFRPMQHALCDLEQRTFMKLVCVGEDERVIGLHMVGLAVDEMLQGFSVALGMGARKADFDATLAIHPTASEELVLLR